MVWDGGAGIVYPVDDATGVTDLDLLVPTVTRALDAEERSPNAEKVMRGTNGTTVL